MYSIIRSRISHGRSKSADVVWAAVSLNGLHSNFVILPRLVNFAIRTVKIFQQGVEEEKRFQTDEMMVRRQHAEIDRLQVQRLHSRKMADTHSNGAEDLTGQVLLVPDSVWFNTSARPDFDDDRLAESWTPWTRPQKLFLRAHSGVM